MAEAIERSHEPLELALHDALVDPVDQGDEVPDRRLKRSSVRRRSSIESF
jgi:hypothetical protein